MFVMLSTADTDLLAARDSGAAWRVANPSRLDPAEVPALCAGADLVVVRLLGGRRTWPEGLAGAISIYALGNTDTETAAIVEALEKALKPSRQ